MPFVNIEYDDTKISAEEIQNFSEGLYKIMSDLETIQEVIIYTNTAQIKINIPDIEVMVRTGSHVMDRDKELIMKIKKGISTWKKESGFIHPINLTLIPMVWQTEFGI